MREAGSTILSVQFESESKALRIALFLLVFLLLVDSNALCLAQPESASKGLARDSETTPDTGTRTGTLLKLSTRFYELVQQHLHFADGYDIDAFRKNDDEINTVLDQSDSEFLHLRSLAESGKLPDFDEKAEKEAIQKAKLFMYKSSSIFYLCFGQPFQSSQRARLALSIADRNPKLPDLNTYRPDVLAYLGSALCWSGQYQEAQNILAPLVAAAKGARGAGYTQLKAGQIINQAGQNPFAPLYLASVYLAQGDTANAINVLQPVRMASPTTEVRGNADALLALAFALQKNPVLANKHAALAAAALNATKQQTFPAIAKESSGIAAAIQGDYKQADSLLSLALTGLQASPVKLGHRLEAAQAALWRSYCRDKLGDAAGSLRDRQYAMSFADEAPHLISVSRMLDRLFRKNLTTPVAQQLRDKWAVIVGVGNFADQSIPRLKYSVADARDMADFLQRHAGFKPDHIKLLVDRDATRSNVMDALTGSWLPRVSRPDDLVYFYVSSHGTPAYYDIGALNALVLHDSKVNELFATTVPIQALVRSMRTNLPKRYILGVMDTCYSGGVKAPGEEARTNSSVDPELLLSSNYQLFVSSCQGHEKSWESKRYANGVFSRQLIETLKQHPDYDQFHFIFGDVRSRVMQEVAADYPGNTQTPRLSGIWSAKGFIHKQ